MMFGEYKVQIVERPGYLDNRIYMFRQYKGHMEFVTHIGNVVTVQEDELVKDDEVYFAEMTTDQLRAFSEALASRGVKTRNDSFAEGKLAATERHLEDMRLIALKGKK